MEVIVYERLLEVADFLKTTKQYKELLVAESQILNLNKELYDEYLVYKHKFLDNRNDPICKERYLELKIKYQTTKEFIAYSQKLKEVNDVLISIFESFCGIISSKIIVKDY